MKEPSCRLATRRTRVNSPDMMRGAPVGAITLAALTATQAIAGTFTFSPQFETTGQSIFGSGTAAVSISKDNQFLGARWGQADQGGPAAAQISYGNYVNGNGFRLRGETSGRIGLQYGLKIDSGSIDAALPWDVSITTPNANALVNGQKFLVGTSAQFKPDQASFVTRSPTFQFYSDFVFETKARVSGQASADLFFFNKQVSFDKTLVDVNVSQELIGLNRDNDGAVRVLPFLFSAASTARDAYDSAQAARELKQEVNSATGRREKVRVALRKLGVTFSLESPVDASVRLPYIEMSGQNLVRDGNKLRQSDKDGFAEFSFDLDRIANMMFPTTVPPMTVNADLDFAVGSLETSATLIDVDFNPTVNLTQQAEVEARKLKIDFDLGSNRAYRVLDANGNVVSTNSGSRFVTLDAGQNLELTYDGSEMNLLPSYRVEAGLNSQFGLSLSSELQFRALMASVEAKLFGLDLGGFEIGPALQAGIQFPDVSLGNLFNQTFDLGGFGSVQGSALFISNRPAVFTGASGGTWVANGNWTVGSSTGQVPDIGRSAIVPDGKTVTASGTGLACFHLEIGRNSQLDVNGTLAVGGSIYNSGRFNVGANATVNFEEDATATGAHTLFGGTFSLGNQSQLVLKNNAATSAVNADLTVVGTTLSMENASLKLQGGPGRLWLGNGTTVNVTNTLGNSANRSVIGTVDGYGLDIVKYGTRPVAVNLTQNANLLVEFGSMSTVFPTQNPTPSELIEGEAAVLSDMLTFNVGNGSTLALKGATNASNLSSFATPGTIQGARFNTTGSGVVKNFGNVVLSASILNGNFVADSADNAAGVTTVFKGLGSTTGEVTPVVNNGMMTFIARSGSSNTILTDGGAIAGSGEMRLISAGAPVSIQRGGFESFINSEGHTIRVDSAQIGSYATGGGSFKFFNNGNLIVDKAIGSGTGNLYINNGNSDGDVVNEGTGLIRAQNGASINFANSTYLNNFGQVEVGDLSTASISAGTANIWSFSQSTLFTTIFMESGSWKTEYSGRLTIGGFQLSSVATILSSKSELEVSANFASPDAGISIRRASGVVTRINDFATFRNENTGTFRLSRNSTVTFPDFENYGILDLSNSTINGVQNYAGGIVFGSGEVKLQQTSPNVATNAGSIIAMPGEGNRQLTVSAAPGVIVIQNNGTMGGVGADLVFPSGVIVSSSGGTLNGGTWVVEGGTTDNPTSARILMPLANANLSAVSNTKVTLKGPSATLDSTFAGGAIRSFQDTFKAINAGAILTLDNNAQTFANRVAVNTSGQLILNGSARVAGAGLDVYGLVAGNGSVNTAIKTYGGTVEAENGLLTFNESIDNTAIVGGFSGTVLANDPGAVLNPNGIAINGGRLIINNLGAGLYGSGTMSPTTFQNNGVVAADRFTFQFTGSGNFSNTNLMTTRERGVLEFASMTLNNAGGVVSAVDTNGLDLQSDGGGIGGTIRLRGATISGGAVLLSGYTSYKGGASDPVLGVNCKLDGYGSLSNVTLQLSNAQLNVNPSQVPDGTTMNITPAAGTSASFYNSAVTARNGGNLTLRNGAFTAIGSTLTADDASFINLDGARLDDGKLVTFGSGRLRVVGTSFSTISNLKNTGRIDNLAGAKLIITNTVDNRGGTVDNRGTITLNAADLVGGLLMNYPGSTVYVPNRAQVLGVNFVNAGVLSVDTGGNLTINQSDDGASSASSFSNIGSFTCAGQAKVVNSLFTTSGDINVLASGSLTATTLAQNAGTVRINGTASVANYQLNAGTLYGAGRITGSLTNNGGVIAPGNSPGTLTVGGDVVLTSDSELDMQISFIDEYDRIVSEGGDMQLTGRVILDFYSMDPEAMGAIYGQPTSFDLFDVAPGKSITAQGLFFEAVGFDVHMSNVAFDPSTGSVSVVITPEPTALISLLPLVLFAARQRR